MKNWLLTLALCSIITNVVICQIELLDSFLVTLNDLPEDTIKVKALLVYSGEVRNNNPPLTIMAAKKALEISQKIGDDKSRIKSNYMIAAGFLTISAIDSCLYYSNDALKISIQKKNNDYRLGDIYNLIGTAHRTKGDHQNAISFGFKSVAILEAQNDEEGLAYAFNTLGTLYWDNSDLINAKKYFLKARDYFLIIKDSINISNVYLNLSLVTDVDKLNYLSQAENIALSINNIYELPYIYTNYGSYYLVDSIDYHLAGQYLNTALQYANQIEDPYAQGQIWNNLATLYNATGQQDSSLFYTKKSLIASQQASNLDEIQDAYYLLYQIYKSKNNTDSSFYYLEKAVALKDTLYNQEVLTGIENANALYETEKKDAEIARQELEIIKQENAKNKILGGSTIALLLAGSVFLWFNQRQKLKKKNTEIALKQKALEAQKFKELDVMKNQFFTNISHELRTPLTLIMGPLVNALEKSTDPALNKDIKLAQTNTHRLLDMINEILDLSKLENGNVPINKDEVIISSFFKRILHAFDSAAEIRNIELIYRNDIDANQGCFLDLEKTETILNNLISNAIKFSPNDQKIVMSLNRNQNNLLINVIDNGPGIPVEEQKHIFNRFYQASNTLESQGSGGFGVGLALSKSLSQLMKGSLTIDSTQGKGSKFSLSLPTSFVALDPETPTEKIDAVQPLIYEPILFNGQKPHVLIIEDNQEMQNFIKEILEEDYRISTANDGYEGIQMIQTHNFDLVSCDVMMPKMDGFTLKEKTNELDLLNDIPFVFLTAKTLEEDKLQGLRLGVDDYISKPFNKYEYKARIHNLMENRKSRLEYLSLNTDYALQNMDSVDQQILKKAEYLINEQVSNPSLKVSDLADSLNYSQRQLSRVIKKLTGMTPVKFVLELRLQRAYNLLKNKSYSTVKEVQYEIGIESASYFNRKFKERFGLNPGEL